MKTRHLSESVSRAIAVIDSVWMFRAFVTIHTTTACLQTAKNDVPPFLLIKTSWKPNDSQILEFSSLIFLSPLKNLLNRVMKCDESHDKSIWIPDVPAVPLWIQCGSHDSSERHMAQQQPLISGHDVLRLPETSPSAARDPRDPIPGASIWEIHHTWWFIPRIVSGWTNPGYFDGINGVSPLVTGVN